MDIEPRENAVNRLIVVASGSDSDLTSAIHRIRCVIEQVNPDLREFARIAAHVTGFARKILGDTNVREFAMGTPSSSGTSPKNAPGL